MKNNQKEPDKKIAILEATLELIAERGFHDTPTSQIAKKANAGVGSIYRYFADKDELIRTLFEYVIDKENREVMKGYNPDAPIRERYIHICTSIIQFALQHPKEAKFIEQFRYSPYGLLVRPDEMIKYVRSQDKKPPLIELFETAIAQQVIKDLPLFVLAALTFGSILALAHDITVGIAPYNADHVQRAVEACWDAVKR